MIVCICERVQCRWARNDSLAPRLIKVVGTTTSNYDSLTMSDAGFILNDGRLAPRAVGTSPKADSGLYMDEGGLPFVTGMCCFYRDSPYKRESGAGE